MINQLLKESEIFSTQELSLSAALVAWGFPLDCVDKINPSGKATFIFLRSKELDQAVQAFWNNSSTVNPKFYFNALKEVKSRLYGG